MTDTNGMSSASREAEIAELCEEISGRLRRGETPDLEDYAARWPQHADELRRLLPAMQMLAGLKDDPQLTNSLPPHASTMADEPLGDFRIVREIGRGGMGIVYEAEQVSLRRRVALKVLPFAAVLDSRQLRRFQNEAHAAALLHHPQIVPVHAVGCDRGVHYYVMQLIHGQTLADVICQLRLQAGMDRSRAKPGKAAAAEEFAVDGADVKSCAATVARQGILSTARSHRSTSFVHAVVRLGIKVAEALDYAHQEGVLHRDIKPGNLLLGEHGQVWVTDFGVARVESEPALTMTGDLVGTLRYMSPEQALGNQVVIDHRTDVYALGATLYELLTLQPVFTGEDRQTLLRQIAFEEPRRLRQVERNLPATLETILLKALAKNPQERYASAGALAEDLQRFLEQKPIRARRPSLVDRGAKWASRNRRLMVVGMAGLLLAVVILAAASLLIWREQHKTQDALGVAISERSNATLEGQRATQLAGDLQRHLYVSGIRMIEQLATSGQRSQLTEQLNAVREADGDGVHRGFEWYYWWHRSREDSLLVLPGHPQLVRGLAFFPDGRRFATCGGRLVRIWDTTTGSMVQELRSPKLILDAVVISPDGKRLVSVGLNRMYVWELPNVRLTPDLETVIRASGELHFVDAGDTLIVTDGTGVGRFWDLNRGVETRTVAIHLPYFETPPQKSIPYAWSRSSTRVAMARSAGVGNQVRVTDIEHNGVSVAIPVPGGRVISLRFTPDDQLLARVAADGQVMFVSVATQESTHQVQLPVGSIVCADFDAQCETLVTVDDKQQGQVWNVRTGECLARISGLPASICRFADDARTVVAAGPDGFVGIWQPFMGLPVNCAGHSRETWSVAFSPDGRLLASGSDDETVRLWNVLDGTEQRILHGHKATVTGVAFSPDGSILASASLDSCVKLWRVSDGAEITTLHGHPKRVCSLAFSPSGKWLASGGDEVVIWDVLTGKEVTKFHEVADRRVNALCFSPDGSVLAVGSNSNQVQLLDTRDWRVWRSLDHEEQVWCVDFSPDGRMLATGDKAGNVSIWNTADGSLVADYRAHTAYVRSVRFTRDGQTLASGGDDHRIVLWDPVTLKELCVLKGHSADVYALAFSPDDGLLASGSYDGAIRFWHAERQ